MTAKSRNWCFTVNNPEYEREVLFEKLGNFKYAIIGKEVGEVEGTPHYQCYVDFTNPRVLGGLKKIDQRIHWEPRRGTWEQAVNYCKKEGDWVERGTPQVGQGTRTDIISITDRLRDGKSDKEILEEFGDKALRMMGCVSRGRAALCEQLRNWPMDVRIYCGPPGSGKSRAVWEEFGIENVYPKMVGKWWDGYLGQTCVLIDDFDPDNCFDIMFDFYLKLLDRYPMRIEYKGGSCNFYSHTIIFTSNFHWDDWFVNKGNRSAFFRRVSEYRWFPEPGTEVGGGNTDPPTPNMLAALADIAQASPAVDEPTWIGIVREQMYIEYIYLSYRRSEDD